MEKRTKQDTNKSTNNTAKKNTKNNLEKDIKGYSKEIGDFFTNLKIDMRMIWALMAQVIFAIFIIIALYAVEFKIGDTRHTVEDWSTNSDIYGLSISGIVLAFVGIILPIVSLFYKNENVNFAFGWSMVVIDIAAFTVITAAISLFAVYNPYNKGYLAGQLIFDLVGTGIAMAGIWMSYNKSMLNKGIIDSIEIEL